MAGLLFYFPKAKGGVVEKWFDEAGIGGLLRDDDAKPMQCDAHVLTGPDGQTGGRLSFWDDPSDPKRTPKPAIEASQQTWLKAPASDGREVGAYYVGYWNDKPPTPEDLLRTTITPSAEVKLGRDKWLIPIAREMPQTYGLDADGRTTWAYEADEHQAYFDEAMRLHRDIQESLDASGGQTFNRKDDELLPFVFQALAMNYRVTPEVLALIKAIRREQMVMAVVAAAGMPLVLNEAKKSEADTSVGAGG